MGKWRNKREARAVATKPRPEQNQAFLFPIYLNPRRGLLFSLWLLLFWPCHMQKSQKTKLFLRLKLTTNGLRKFLRINMRIAHISPWGKLMLSLCDYRNSMWFTQHLCRVEVVVYETPFLSFSTFCIFLLCFDDIFAACCISPFSLPSCVIPQFRDF